MPEPRPLSFYSPFDPYLSLVEWLECLEMDTPLWLAPQILVPAALKTLIHQLLQKEKITGIVSGTRLMDDNSTSFSGGMMQSASQSHAPLPSEMPPPTAKHGICLRRIY